MSKKGILNDVPSDDWEVRGDSTETDKLLAETEEWLKANPQNFEEPDQLQQNANKRLFNGARAPIRNARFAAPPRDWHRTLAETYAVREQYAEARRHYALCQDTDLNGSTHLWIADYCVAENLWAEAAEAYRQAWEEDNSSEMNLFLQGWALHHAGGDSKAKGDELMLTARLLMLGSSSGGYDLVRMLWEQGDTDLAEPVSRLLMNLASPDDAESILTGARLYMHLRYTDKESEAAALCERFMLFCMTKSLTSDYARLFAGFLPSRSWIDTLLARADLRKGDTAAAMEKINTALKLTPGDSSAVEDFHPMLRERNLTAEANTVFDQVFPVSLNTIKTFPNYEQGHNNHAWLLARCQRNLDEALTHAQAALKIDPKSAASTDTLAEVYFAKGDFQKAVEASDKALKLTPTDAQLKTQNQRFRAALEKSKQ